MMLFNIIFATLALIFAYRGAKLFFFAHRLGLCKESVIGLSLACMHALIFTRSIFLIELGADRIQLAGLLLNYYMYVGTITIQILVSDFIISFVYDRITRKTGS
jgi:hypothetical protein